MRFSPVSNFIYCTSRISLLPVTVVYAFMVYLTTLILSPTVQHQMLWRLVSRELGNKEKRSRILIWGRLLTWHFPYTYAHILNIHTRIIYTYIYIHTFIHTAHDYIHADTYIRTYIYTLHVHIYRPTYSIHTYIYIYTIMHIYIHAHTYKHTYTNNTYITGIHSYIHYTCTHTHTHIHSTHM